jgi:hypothetical protein
VAEEAVEERQPVLLTVQEEIVETMDVLEAAEHAMQAIIAMQQGNV